MGGKLGWAKKKCGHEMDSSFSASRLNWGPHTSENMRNHTSQKCHKMIMGTTPEAPDNHSQSKHRGLINTPGWPRPLCAWVKIP